LALELSGRARVNAIAPGLVETDGYHEMNAGDDFRNYVISRSIVKRTRTPEDIASAAVYLASDDSAWVSGETLIVSGGARM
jgi:3-oxoacyl-[acyl-carrier protein] reductase